MNTYKLLEIALITAGLEQISIELLNFFLVRLLGWKEELRRAPLLLREVFYVHSWFISVTLAIFGALTLRFSDVIACEPLGRWLAAGVGLFWGIRTVLQVAYYSSAHWRGHTGRTVIHITLLFLYGGMAATYLLAAMGNL